MPVESSVRAGFMNIEQEITMLSSNYSAVRISVSLLHVAQAFGIPPKKTCYLALFHNNTCSENMIDFNRCESENP